MELELWDDTHDHEELSATDDKSLKAVYTALELVPEDHVKDNEVFKKIIRFSERKKGAYYSNPNVVLQNRPADDNITENGWMDSEAEEIGEDYQRDPSAEPARLYDFFTLHEVGHAVDADRSFMKGRMGGEDFGAWVDYKTDCDPIAQVAADHFKYDKAHIKLMLEKKDPKPEDLSQGAQRG